MKEHEQEQLLRMTDIDSRDVISIEPLKKGMTNNSYLIVCTGESFILRIPGEGTDKLIDRVAEAEVYRIVGRLGISDDVRFVNAVTGVKETGYIADARTCDAGNWREVAQCMTFLKRCVRLDGE